MKIGYCVEGANRPGAGKGPRRSLVSHGELVEGRFRGSTGLRLRAEIPRICQELNRKSCDVYVFLTDANDATWTEVFRNQSERIPPEFRQCAISGVADRNIGCWLCADKEWIARETGRNADEFEKEDPKIVFESAFGISARKRKEPEIIAMVTRAALKYWIQNEVSFERFYRAARRLANSLNCSMPDELA